MKIFFFLIQLTITRETIKTIKKSMIQYHYTTGNNNIADIEFKNLVQSYKSMIPF